MQKCFREQISRNLEVYVDDIVVKTHVATQLIDDLEETLCNLRANHIKLNLEKCVFGVPARKLLGFNISEHVNRDQPQEDLSDQGYGANQEPEGSLEAHRLLGGAQPLHILPRGTRYVSIKLLKKSERFEWT